MRRWASEVEDPRTLGLFRVLLGVLVVLDVASLWPHVDDLYGDDGMMPPAQACRSGLRAASALCIFGGAENAAVLIGLFVMSGLAFAAGAGTRVTKWTTAYLFWSVVQRNHLPLAGEQVFGNFLFLLCLSRCHAAYSVDNWLRCRRLRAHGRLDDGDPHHAAYRPIPAWPRWLMIAQLCLAYGVAGWAKTGATWIDGTSLYYLLANDRWFRFEPWWLLSTFGTNLLRVATWGALWFERLFVLVAVGLVLRRHFPELPAWLRWPTSRWVWAPLCLVFTSTLILLVNLGWFVPGTLAATVVLFRGEEVGAVVDRVVSRPHRAPGESIPLRRSTAGTVGLTMFVAWHGFAMTVNAIALPNLSLGLPPAVRSVTSAWGRSTNTWQFWGMFSPNAPKVRQWLIVDVETASGRTYPTTDSRSIIGQRDLPYVLVDRRAKMHAKIARRPALARLHASHLCRTWRSPHGEQATVVVISRWTWPLPDPRWMATHGPHDPRPAAQPYRRDETLLRWSCLP